MIFQNVSHKIISSKFWYKRLTKGYKGYCSIQGHSGFHSCTFWRISPTVVLSKERTDKWYQLQSHHLCRTGSWMQLKQLRHQLCGHRHGKHACSQKKMFFCYRTFSEHWHDSDYTGAAPRVVKTCPNWWRAVEPKSTPLDKAGYQHSPLSTDRVAPNPGSIKFPLLDVPMGWRNPDWCSSFSTLRSTIALTSGTWSWSRSAISAAPGSKPSFLRYFAVKEFITSKLEKKLWKCKCM